MDLGFGFRNITQPAVCVSYECNFMDKIVSFVLANSCPVWPEIGLLANLLAGRQICQRGQIHLLDIFYKEKGLFWGQNNKNI